MSGARNASSSAGAAARGLSSKAPVVASSGGGSSSSAYRSIDQASNTITPQQQAIIDQVDAYYKNDEAQLQQLGDLASANYKIAYDKVIATNADTLKNDTLKQDTNVSDNLSKAWMSLFATGSTTKSGSETEFGQGGGEQANIANAFVRARDTAVANEKASIAINNDAAQKDYTNKVAQNTLDTQRKIAADEDLRRTGRAATMSELLGLGAANTNLINSTGLTDTTPQDTTTAANRALGNPAPDSSSGYLYAPNGVASSPAGQQVQAFAGARQQARLATY